MICQEKVLKKNWDFNRGELYIIDYDRGERPRKSTLEISVILFPEEAKESTRWFYVVPITLDLRGIDPESDVTIRNRDDIGRPYVAMIKKGHMIEEYQLLSYVGQLTVQSTNMIAKRTIDDWEKLHYKKAPKGRNRKYDGRN